MKQMIPLEIAELAISNKEQEINELKKEIAEIKEAGRSLSLKIHRAKTFAEFYPVLGEFERLVERK